MLDEDKKSDLVVVRRWSSWTITGGHILRGKLCLAKLGEKCTRKRLCVPVSDPTLNFSPFNPPYQCLYKLPLDLYNCLE